MAFTEIDPGESPLVVAVWGEPKSGKTHFACTFPAPVRFLNLNFGLRDIRKHFPGKDIKESKLPIIAVKELMDCQPILAQFHADYNAAIKECQATGGTVVIDTASELWEIVQTVKLAEVRSRRSKTGKADDVKPMQFDYGEVNSLMASYIRQPLYNDPVTGAESRVNAVFIHGAKPHYNDAGQATGRMEFKGFGQTTGLAPITLQMKGPGLGRLDYCRPNQSLAGSEIGDLDYALLRDLVAA